MVDIKRQKQKEHDAKVRMQGAFVGAMAMLTALGGGMAINNAQKPAADFDTRGNSIEEVADFCDIDPRAIAIVNGLESDETADKIIMPEKLDIESDLAEVYTVEGSKFAYIIPKDYGISAEDIKEAFKIEDGVLKKYNDLSYDWATNDELEVHRGYKDYSSATVPYEGIRVPLKELNY